MGPSESEVRLRTELDRVRRELAQLKKEPVGAIAPEAVESADPRLEQRIAELERTKERLSKLYFAQLDENRKRSARLHAILRVVTEINADRDLETLVQRVADTIKESLGFRLVLIRLREPGQSRLAPVAFAGLEGSARVALEAEPVSLEDLLSWTRDEFRVSRSFFIGHKHPFSRQLPAGYVPDLGRREEWEWHPEDVLLVPLTDARGEPMGYFSVDDPEDRLVPSQETVELLEVFAGHAVVAIENARLYRQLAQRTGELEEADRRMREMDEIKRQFVTAVSHELRTPLTAIRAHVDALSESAVEAQTPTRLETFVQVVDDESRRLARLVESVLDLGKLEAGSRSARRKPIDLSEVVGEAARMLERMAEAREVELKVLREMADTQLDADRDQLRQLVLHLGGNAVKFTSAGGRVVIRTGGDDRSVTLQVEDTGIGIPADALGKIFDRFYQVDSPQARRPGGAGLGLAICKSIVEWHGGELEARSTPGQGSIFRAVLPRRAAPPVVLRPASGLSEATRDVLRLGVEMVSEVMNAGMVSLMSLEPAGSLRIEAAIGLDRSVVAEARTSRGEGIAGWVAEHRRPVCVAGPEGDPVPRSGRSLYRTGTYLSVPLLRASELVGVLNVTEPANGRSFQLEDCHLLLELSEAIAHAWHAARASDERRAGVAVSAGALRTVLEHVRRTRKHAPESLHLVQTVAREFGLQPGEVALVAFAAAVHDVGMAFVDRAILHGAAPLTPEQRALVQQHVVLGDEVLARLETMGADSFERLDVLSAVREIVLCHHEWWDGTGYPRALRGTSIPAGARVLAVVDAYESLTEGRPHRPARMQEEALREIAALAGKQFDPDAVDALERALNRDSAGTPARSSATPEARR
jgi:signal transduction histidine kinase/HD-GYP domain-containing protein (c-di-GMP phosphodiesterase class II)